MPFVLRLTEPTGSAFSFKTTRIRLRDCFFRALRRWGLGSSANITKAYCGNLSFAFLHNFVEVPARSWRFWYPLDRAILELLTSSNIFIAARENFDGLASHLHRWLEACSLYCFIPNLALLLFVYWLMLGSHAHFGALPLLFMATGKLQYFNLLPSSCNNEV